MTQFEHYRVFAELHRGPITTIFKAYQPDLERPVLVKVLNREWINDRDLVERFRREGQASARVRHPNVVTVYDFGFSDGRPYLVIEFVEGITLAGLIAATGALPAGFSAHIAREVAAGLSAVHENEIVHRDVKPANIFLSHAGDVRLGDFGLAAELVGKEVALAGTPAYLAPESIAGESQGTAADLFALGATIYEMISGENPFADRSASRTIHHVVNLQPQRLHVFLPEIPALLDEVCAQLLSKSPKERPDAESVVDLLNEVLDSVYPAVDSAALSRFLADPDSRPTVVLAGLPLANAGGSAPIAADRRHERLPSPEPATVHPLSVHPGSTPGEQRSRRLVLAAGVLSALAVLVVLAATLFRSEGKQAGEVPAISDDLTQAPIRGMPAEAESLGVHSNESSAVVAGPTDGRRASLRAPVEATPETVTVSTPVLAPAGWLSVTSDPRAVVFVDGDSVGVTPLVAALKLPPGEHLLCLSPPGWPSVCKTVTVARAETLQVASSLWNEVGYLEVDVAPWGEIWIDGERVDTTPLQRPLVLSPGEHTLEVRHPSLGGKVEHVSLAAGDTLRRRFRLQASSP